MSWLPTIAIISTASVHVVREIDTDLTAKHIVCILFLM